MNPNKVCLVILGAFGILFKTLFNSHLDYSGWMRRVILIPKVLGPTSNFLYTKTGCFDLSGRNSYLARGPGTFSGPRNYHLVSNSCHEKSWSQFLASFCVSIATGHLCCLQSGRPGWSIGFLETPFRSFLSPRAHEFESQDRRLAPTGSGYYRFP